MTSYKKCMGDTCKMQVLCSTIKSDEMYVPVFCALFFNGYERCVQFVQFSGDIPPRVDRAHFSDRIDELETHRVTYRARMTWRAGPGLLVKCVVLMCVCAKY